MVKWSVDSSNTVAVEPWVHEFRWGNADKNGNVEGWDEDYKADTKCSNSPNVPDLESFVNHIDDDCRSTRDLTELFPPILSLPPSSPTVLEVD